MADGEGVVASRDRRKRASVTPARWKQVEAVFEQALELPTDERAAFLESTCNGDEELRREVESLLSSHERAGSFIDKRSLFFSTDALDDVGAAVAGGQLIGQYRVIRELGRGGMGAVYLAERADEQYRKQVAIKVIKRGMDTESVLRHFRNERQILATFDHPNIARLFDGGTTDAGLPYFVMEYVEGVPIDRYCDAHQFSVTERLKLFLQVCSAVNYAHRHTVIHRDIKPSNILVTSDGDPKLLDFGIAKMLQQLDGRESFVTATGARPMTPEYASPEQVRGEPVTTASDVYSLGVVLYGLLTGTSPYRFASGAPRDVERVITEQQPTKPSTVTRNSRIVNGEPAGSRMSARHGPNYDSRALRGDLDNIVLMALRKEPARRYQSVEQFAGDIRRHLESRPVMARPDTVAYRTRKFIQRNRVATAATLLIFLSLVAGLVAATWEAHRARVETARAQRRFNDVRRLAHSVLFDYHDAIKDLPGATRARERLVKDALTYLDGLAREAGGDPELQRELAAAYERVGDVRGQPYSANLGDRAGALESYDKSRRIRETLLAGDAANAQTRREVAAIYRKIGNILLETTDAPRGLELLRRALAVDVDLAKQQPHDSDIRRELAEIHNDLGGALEERGEMSAALAQHREALRLREELARRDLADWKAQRDLSVSQTNTGRILFFTGDIPGALAINSKALDTRQRLLAHDPTNADYRRLLAIAYQNDGDYRAQGGDIEGARESFEKKIVLDEQALAADPANVQAQRDFAYSSERLGVFSTQLGQRAEARVHFEQTLATREKIVADDPQNLNARYGLAIAEGEVALSAAQTGQRDRALAQCRKTVAQLNELSLDPTNAYLYGLRARAYGFLGDAYAALAKNKDDWQNARVNYERSLALWNDLRERKLLAADDAAKPDEIARAIAKCDASLETKSFSTNR